MTYLKVESKSDLIFDISHSNDVIRVNMDILFHRMPCDVLTLDVKDIMGAHISNSGRELMKKKISEAGHVISQESIREEKQKPRD